MTATRQVEQFTDDDSKRTILSAIKWMIVIVVVAGPLIWWKSGWPSAALLAIGAVISGSGLYEWLRLMTSVMERMDSGSTARPLGMILAGFFLRIGLTIVILYVSLRFLEGSVYALAAGLALGVMALSVEGLRLIKAWTT